jgi:hypothetical protein
MMAPFHLLIGDLTIHYHASTQKNNTNFTSNKF